jgi:uncharacterized membrane protein
MLTLKSYTKNLLLASVLYRHFIARAWLATGPAAAANSHRQALPEATQRASPKSHQFGEFCMSLVAGHCVVCT